MIFTPLPLSQTVTLSQTPSPWSVTYFMDGPLYMRARYKGRGWVQKLSFWRYIICARPLSCNVKTSIIIETV